MDHTEAKQRLESLVAAAGKPEGEVTPADLLNIAITFYETYPCDGCDPQEDADILLFQSGLYDCGKGKNFEVDFVRQFILNDDAGEYDHMEQLHCTFYYPASLAEGKNIDFNVWSIGCSSLADFRTKVTEADGFRLALEAKPRRIRIHQEQV